MEADYRGGVSGCGTCDGGVDQILADQKKETAKVDRALALADQREEIEELKMRLGALEAKLAG